MKVSFIIVTSSTKSLADFDKKSWPDKDEHLDNKINLHTNKLINQILSFQIEKEIIVVDNTGDFKQTVFSNEIRVVEGYYSHFKKGTYKTELSIPIQDWLPSEPDHTLSASMNYNIGLNNCTGDYIIMQHNDTEYLFNDYGSDNMIMDAITLLEDGKLEYITVDKKSPKDTSPKHIQYFSDCYWFLCRKEFYRDNNIWVDWSRGDTNHLATIFCIDNKLNYLHLPGYYESGIDLEKKAWRKFNKLAGYPGEVNIHYLNSKPFLLHIKGGTGLKGITKLNNTDG